MSDVNNKIEKLAEELVSLTVKEVTELITCLKNNHKIEPASAAPITMAMAPAADVEKSEEKTSFDVILKAAGASKLAVMKLVKDLTGLGLKESKELVDNVPKLLKEGVNKDDAEALKKKLEEAGAQVEIK